MCLEASEEAARIILLVIDMNAGSSVGRAPDKLIGGLGEIAYPGGQG